MKLLLILLLFLPNLATADVYQWQDANGKSHFSDHTAEPNAKKIENISWAEYRKLIPSEWNPGLNSPFDPIASEMAEREGIEVVIMNGKPIDNLKNYLDGSVFLGTVIS